VSWAFNRAHVSRERSVKMSADRGSQLGLAVFDLDGTLTTVRSPFLYVSEAFGVGSDARDIADRYWRGEISYRTWGREIAALWSGRSTEELRRVVAQIPYRPGVMAFLRRLKQSGVIVALLSVAFEQHVRPRGLELGVDYMECNELHEEKGRLTGKFSHRVDHANKRELVRRLQRSYGKTPEHTLVAGDTTGDVAMFGEAVVSIAVDPESLVVQEAASLRLPNDDWGEAWNLINEQRPNWLPEPMRFARPNGTEAEPTL